jgi:hypothetical protein
MIYTLIGKAVVRLGWIFLRRRAAARKALLAGAGVAAAGVAVVAVTGYLITRETPEA